MTVLRYLFEHPGSTLCLFSFISLWLSMLVHGVKRTGFMLGVFTSAFYEGFLDADQKKSRKRPPS